MLKTTPENFKGVGITAHFTAAVWAELGVPNATLFSTGKGRVMSKVVQWGGATLGLFGKYNTVNLFLKVRHLGINALLEQKKPLQVIELAAGLSPRGYSWVQNHNGTYIEVDQAAVIEAKSAILAKQPGASAGKLELVVADLVHDDYARALAQEPALNSQIPTLIIVEGLTGYLGAMAMQSLLQKIHRLASRFKHCTVLIDFYLKLKPEKHGRVAYAMYPPQLLWRILNAPMRMFLESEKDIRELAKLSGFDIRCIYTVRDLASLANTEPPPVGLFYVVELQVDENPR
jgi:hypothetical protein